MGLSMDDLHTPTVPSGPTSSSVQNGLPKKDLSLTDLITERDRVEGEITALCAVLESHKVDMNTSLITFDGFPRSDIDVAQIRTTRARIIHLRNDYKDLMKRIEEGLHSYHANLPSANDSTSPARESGQQGRSVTEDQASGMPFAKVNSIVPQSPADSAGLQAGDFILKFGGVNWLNHDKLSKVAEEVSANEGRAIAVVIRRETTSSISLTLIPRRNWGGRGLLGCHLLPL